MRRNHKVIIITLICFGIYFLIDEYYFRSWRSQMNEFVHLIGISHMITYLLVGIPIFLGIVLNHPVQKFWDAFGLNRSFFKAFVFALVCTSPMFIGYALVSDFNPDLSTNNLLITVFAAAFFEELYFRGFLFGQLFRYTRLGFILSVVLGAILFGLVHLYQGDTPLEAVGVFAITCLGGFLFAWVFAEWNFNIWIPICLHLLMNLSWELFSVDDSALGNVYANIFRLLTILLIILITVRIKKNNKIPLSVNRRNIWLEQSRNQPSSDRN